MIKTGSRQRKDHDSDISQWHRAALLSGWFRRCLDGELVYVREMPVQDVVGKVNVEVVSCVEDACLASRLVDIGDVKKFLRKFSN